MTAVDFDELSLHSTATSLMIIVTYSACSVGTVVHALKGQTLAPFDLGQRLTFRIYGSK